MSQFNDYQAVYASLAAITQPGSVFELRLLGDRKGRIDAGYFDDAAQAANALASLNGYYQGVYVTPNPVAPDLLARSANRITPWAQTTTGDTEVTRRKWLLVDIDPKRPKGISSTEDEHQAAIAKGREVSGMLELAYGWCEPMLNSSGNGCHLMYPMDEENTPEVRDEVAKFLKCLQAKYGDDKCEIDTSVFNAARIWRVPGTWARKGDSVAVRPHRQAQILKPITHIKRVSILQVIRFNHDHTHLLTLDQQRSTGRSLSAQEYPDDEKIWIRLNEAAKRRIEEWVPVFFPEAREYNGGYRVTSEDLGLDYEEDLTIHPPPKGIKYFGVSDQGDRTEGRRTPVSLIAEFRTGGNKQVAAHQLSDALKFPISEFTAIPQQAPAGLNGSASMTGLLGENTARPKYSFAAIRTIADLQAHKFVETKWIIPDVLPTGNIMLAARPKMRKTWLALQLGLAVSTGRKFLNWQCEKGDVLFLGLEDNERRLQNRINTLLRFEMMKPDLTGFRYWTGGMDYDARGRLALTNPEEEAKLLNSFPRGEAGVDALDQYLDEFPETTTIIIDTLAHFREGSNNRDIYQRDYDSMMPITKLAHRRRVLVIPVHHEKKGLANMQSGDFLEDVSGSAGITGGVDGVMSIKGRRGVQEENESRKLLISGRDVPTDYELDMTFDAERGGWLTAARQDARVAVRALLERHPFLNQVDLGALLPNTSKSRLIRVLMEMKLEGEINQTKYGYQLRRD